MTGKAIRHRVSIAVRLIKKESTSYRRKDLRYRCRCFDPAPLWRSEIAKNRSKMEGPKSHPSAHPQSGKTRVHARANPCHLIDAIPIFFLSPPTASIRPASLASPPPPSLSPPTLLSVVKHNRSHCFSTSSTPSPPMPPSPFSYLS